jgi:hypothetical protein
MALLACLLAAAAHTNIALTPNTQQAVSVKTVSSNLGNYQDTRTAATDGNGMSDLFSTSTLNVVAGALLAARLLVQHSLFKGLSRHLCLQSST